MEYKHWRRLFPSDAIGSPCCQLWKVGPRPCSSGPALVSRPLGSAVPAVAPAKTQTHYVQAWRVRGEVVCHGCCRKTGDKKKTLNAFQKHLTWHFYELWVTVHAGWRYSCWLEQIRSHLCKHSRHKHASTCVRRGRRNPRWRPWSRTPDPIWPSWRRDCFFSRSQHSLVLISVLVEVDNTYGNLSCTHPTQQDWPWLPFSGGSELFWGVRTVLCTAAAAVRVVEGQVHTLTVNECRSWVARGHSTKRTCWSFRKYGVKFVLKKGSNSKTARRNVAVLSCLCPRGQNNNLEWLRNNLIQNRTSHFPAFFPSRHTPFCTQLHKKKKETFSQLR